MELNIILLYDSNINTFINNLNIPTELQSQLNINIFIIYNNNSIVQDINSTLNINYYNLTNINDILKHINSENILYITNNNITICTSFYYTLFNFTFSNNIYYLIPLLVYDSKSLYIIKNNTLEICDTNIKYELQNDVTGLLYDNNELHTSNDNIQINYFAILMTKTSWEQIGFNLTYKNIIYKCILNSFEQFIYPLQCSNILLSNISDISIEKPNINDYIPYNLKYTTPRRVFKGRKTNTNNKPPKIIQRQTNNTHISSSITKNNIKNIIKEKKSVLNDLYNLILYESSNTNQNFQQFEQYFNSI